MRMYVSRRTEIYYHIVTLLLLTKNKENQRNARYFYDTKRITNEQSG